MDQNLPFPLPYAMDALEPVISANTLQLHDTLAAGYAKNFPAAQSSVTTAVSQGEQALREQLRTLSFQGSTNRASYTSAWWSLLNWDDVEYRANLAMQGKLPVLA